MSTNKKSPQTKTTPTKQAGAKKAIPSAKSTVPKAKKPAGSDAPKKKPGRPKKQAAHPASQIKPNAVDRDKDGLVKPAKTTAASPVVKNVQSTGATIPPTSTTTAASGVIPQINVNLGWQTKKPIGFWGRLSLKFKRKR